MRAWAFFTAQGERPVATAEKRAEDYDGLGAPVLAALADGTRSGGVHLWGSSHCCRRAMRQGSQHGSQKSASDQRGAPARLPLPDDVVEVTATRLRVIADPTRIRLMEMLDEGPGSVGGLAAGLGMTRQSVSWHLNVLHQAGIVSRRKDGAWVQYELADWTGWWLVEQVAAGAASELRDRRPSFAQGPARVDRS